MVFRLPYVRCSAARSPQSTGVIGQFVGQCLAVRGANSIQRRIYFDTWLGEQLDVAMEPEWCVIRSRPWADWRKRDRCPTPVKSGGGGGKLGQQPWGQPMRSLGREVDAVATHWDVIDSLGEVASGTESGAEFNKLHGVGTFGGDLP
jgi:hypothetical protein